MGECAQGGWSRRLEPDDDEGHVVAAAAGHAEAGQDGVGHLFGT